MKIAKKLSSIIIALVVCSMLVVTTWATEQIFVTYSGTLDDSTLCENELGKTVTLTIQADTQITIDGLQMEVTVPEGWSITGIANSDLAFNENHYNLDNGYIVWHDGSADGKTTELLASVTIQIPAGIEKKEYEIKSEIIDISRDWGTSMEDGEIITTKLTVGDHADGKTVDHKCDACGEAINGGACTYVPGEYAWSEDYSTCTVTGTCACEKTATATANSTSQVTKEADCQTEKETTYTADFIQSWAETQTKTVKGDKDSSKHVGETTTTYTPDGDKHTVTVTCKCGATIGEPTTEDHADTVGDGNHKCDKCEAVLSECDDVNNDGDHKCDECGEPKSECKDSDTNHICDSDDACDAYRTGDKAHADGDDEDTVCDYCNKPIQCDTCALEPVAEVPATCQTPGCKAYYQCTVCTICYEDENGTEMIEDLKTWKAEGGEGYLAVDADKHIGDPTTSYTNNGENHTVKVSYAGCGHEISSETADHDYTTGTADNTCICGAVKPADPDPEEPKPGLKGDVDLNGVVDMSDFVALAKHIGEVEFITDSVAMKNADVTDDDVVDMNDFTKLAQFIGEIIDEL